MAARVIPQRPWCPEGFSAAWVKASKWLLVCVDPFMLLKCLVTGECFLAACEVAYKRLLARVRAAVDGKALALGEGFVATWNTADVWLLASMGPLVFHEVALHGERCRTTLDLT